jgi:membrane protease YdiL (CAAX protease family)
VKNLAREVEGSVPVSCRPSVVFELVVVTCVCILPLLFDSTWVALRAGVLPSEATPATGATVASIIRCLAGVLLVAYLIHTRGESAWRFGFRVSLSVIPRSLLVFVIAFAAWSVTCVVARALDILGTYPGLVRDHDRMAVAVPPIVLLVRIVASSVFEETVVRSYLMTRLEDLGWRTGWAVVTCTLVQASYHTYQGFIVAGTYVPMFLVFSLYFARYRNLLTLILAHLYFGLGWWGFLSWEHVAD